MSTTFETKAMPGQLTVDEAEGIVECFVAGIGNKDSVGDIVLPGAFNGSLRRRKPRVVWGHDWNHPIGRVLEIYEVGPDDPRLPAKMKMARIGGLFARVQFNLKSERGREAFANILFFGQEQEWSIGYKTIQAVYDNTRQANLLKEVELYEVSPVLHGANQLTATISIKSDKQEEDRVTSFKKSKWPMFDRAFAERIKSDHPKIWDKGGNIKGDDQYTILTKIAEQGGVAKTEDQIKALELREAWIARHLKDFQLPGVIAQIKWLAIGSRGEGHMKDVVREAIQKANEKKGHGYGEYDKPERGDMEELAEMWNRLRGYAAEREGSSDDDPQEELDRIAEQRPEDGDANPAMGRQAVLARALANELRSPVKIRSMSGNTVVFDVMDPTDPDDVTTMRASWHAERGQVMIGKPEPVRVETVYVPVEGDAEGEAYMGDETMKIDPRAGIPQERFTGDVLRGYGPRRGNLERLLRYWRPIMRKPGGFRRCLVILADHPELYPLQNICAWLHHETTGLWPNEGCHHPGMKNCRRKLRGVVRGSLWSNDEFNSRMRKLRERSNDGKGMDWDEDDYKEYGEVTDDDIAFANKVLGQFLREEEDFAKYLADDKNWTHVGDDKDDEEMEHEWVKPEGAPEGVYGKPGGCSCGGKCGGGKSIEESLAELEEKVGRVLNSRNANKITQAIQLLSDVVGIDAPVMERKDDGTDFIFAAVEDIFELKEALDPVLEYHGLLGKCTDDGIMILGLEDDEATVAVKSVVENFADIQTKGIGRSVVSQDSVHLSRKSDLAIGPVVRPRVSVKMDEAVIEAPLEDLPYLREVFEPLVEHYELDAEVDETGIHLKGLHVNHIGDLIGAMVDDGNPIEVKKIGRMLGRMLPGGRGGGRGRGRRSAGSVRFNPDAYDGNSDGTVQDNTPFERPVTPRAGRAAGALDGDGKKKPKQRKPGKTSRMRGNSARPKRRPMKTWRDSDVAGVYNEGSAFPRRQSFLQAERELNARFDDQIKDMDSQALLKAREAADERRGRDETAADRLWREKLKAEADARRKRRRNDRSPSEVNSDLNREADEDGFLAWVDDQGIDISTDEAYDRARDRWNDVKDDLKREERKPGGDSLTNNMSNDQYYKNIRALDSVDLSPMVTYGNTTDKDMDTIMFAVRELQASMSDDPGNGRRVEVSDEQVADYFLDELDGAGAKFDDEQRKKIRSAIEDAASKATRGKPMSQQEMSEQRTRTARRVAFRELGLDGTVLSDKGPSEKEWDALDRLVEEIEAAGPYNDDGSPREIEAADIYNAIYDEIGRGNMTDKEMANLQKIADAYIRDREMD